MIFLPPDEQIIRLEPQSNLDNTSLCYPINIFAPILIAQRIHFNSFDIKLLAVWCLLSSQAHIIQYQLLTSTKTPHKGF